MDGKTYSKTKHFWKMDRSKLIDIIIDLEKNCNCESFITHKDRINSLVKEIDRLRDRNAGLVKERDRFRFIAAKRRRD